MSQEITYSIGGNTNAPSTEFQSPASGQEGWFRRNAGSINTVAQTAANVIANLFGGINGANTPGATPPETPPKDNTTRNIVLAVGGFAVLLLIFFLIKKYSK